MSKENKTRYIRLTHDDGRRETIREPEGFEWAQREGRTDKVLFPPETFIHEGKRWQLAGVRDGYLSYLEEGVEMEAFKPIELTLPLLQPGDTYRWREGPWQIVTVYPAFPYGDGSYRHSVEIADPQGNRFTVDDAFIAQWMVPRGKVVELK